MAEVSTGKIVNQLELADLFGITRQTLRNWQVKGCPVHSNEGKGKAKLFNSAEVYAWREKFLRSSLTLLKGNRFTLKLSAAGCLVRPH